MRMKTRDMPWVLCDVNHCHRSQVDVSTSCERSSVPLGERLTKKSRTIDPPRTLTNWRSLVVSASARIVSYEK